MIIVTYLLILLFYQLFQLFQCLFRGGNCVIKSLHVRKRQLLFGDIDIIDERAVYNETFADSDEETAFFTQLIGNQLFQLSQLVRQDACATIGLHEGRIVTIRADVNDMIRCDTHQFCGGGYNKLFPHESISLLGKCTYVLPYGQASDDGKCMKPCLCRHFIHPKNRFIQSDRKSLTRL